MFIKIKVVFLYKYAGSFLEEATKLCFKHKFPESGTLKIPNTIGQQPKTFEIDCLVDLDAIEIKWRDATTDGDHISKEHTRIRTISVAGFKPVRIMFYYPNRAQAKKIQETLETPVHRNKGIDAVLIEQFDNTHVLVRVQKKDETLSEAISFLLNAKKTKRSKRAILIQTQDSDSFEEIAYHDGLIILQSPSLQIANLLKKELINPSSQFHLRKTSLQNHSKLTFKN